MYQQLDVDFDITQLKWNEKGLIPAVIQDVVSKQVLMVAYMNQESLSKTIETGETWFYSRSRQELWNKGATSGHFQSVKELQIDCDQDTLLIQVEQIGVACHTGTYTCFGEEKQERKEYLQEGNSLQILDQLIKLIAEREKTMPEGSYTTYLFDKGLDKILKKVGEEASEVIIAAKNQQQEEVVYEASDLIYHLLVLLQQQGISFDRVLEELARRHQDQSSDVKFIQQRK